MLAEGYCMLVDKLKDARKGSKTSKVTLMSGAVAAILSSLCCLGPLVLVTVGMSGAWIGNLAALEPYRPVFIGVALVCMAFAYRHIYRAPAAETCEPGTLCALPQTHRMYLTFPSADLSLCPRGFRNYTL